MIETEGNSSEMTKSDVLECHPMTFGRSSFTSRIVVLVARYKGRRKQTTELISAKCGTI